MASPAPTDEELAALAGRGDSVAGSELICRFTPRLLAFLRKPCGLSGQDVEDSAQKVWVRAWPKLARWVPDPALSNPFASWLLTIARNIATDHKKQQGRRQTQEFDDDRLEHAQEGAEVGAGAEHQDDARKLRRCIEKLPPNLRVIFEAYLRGEADAAVANRINVEPGTVRTRRTRGLDLLRACMGVEGR